MSNVCKGCNQQINWNLKIREELGWKGPLNPDNSKHLCPAFAKDKSAAPTIATYDYVKVPQQSQQPQDKAYVVAGVDPRDARSKEIQQAHQENMDASKNMIAAINRLADVIGTMAFLQVAESDLDRETARRRLLNLYKGGGEKAQI